jgi:class 3 adenylate cyclase
VRGLVALGLALAITFALGPVWWIHGAVDWPLHIHALLIGLSLIMAGWVAARWRSGRPIARLMLLSACLYFAPFIGFFGFGGAQLGYLIGWLTEGVWIGVAGHMVVAFPEGKLRLSSEKAVVAAIYAWTVVGWLPLLAAQPTAWGCLDCPRNILQVVDAPVILDAFRVATSVVAPLITFAVIVLLVRRTLRATRPERRVLAPVFVAMTIAAAAVLVFYLSAAAFAAGWVPDAVVVGATVAQRTSILLLPLSFAAGILRGIMARSAASNLLVRVGRGSTVEEIERDVAWALADPSAKLALRMQPGGQEFATLDGRRIELDRLPADAVRVINGRETSAALIHDPSLERDQSELLDTTAAAIQLALDNEHLATELQLQRDLPVGLAERLQRVGARIGDTRTLEISVLMSDIRGYTTLAEQANLHDLALQLNEHRAAMNRVIAAHAGTVMQYVGDMVFAVFGAPTPSADHAARAVDAAIAMQAAQAEVNAGWRSTGLPAFGLGIAISTGEVAAALLGSEEHVEYSVVGDAVNLAQRLQVMAAAGEIVISEGTHGAIDAEIPQVQLPTTTVKGRRAPVTAYRLDVVPRPIAAHAPT